MDDGRVNLYQSAQKDENGKFVSTRLTSKTYQKKAGILAFKEWDLQYRKDYPELPRAYEEMSTHSWKTCKFEKFMEAVKCFRRHFEAFDKHFIVGKDYALKRMYLWRTKMSVMARSYSETLKRSGVDKTNTKIILSVGNAKFASTGKKGREKNSGGVPTNGKHKIMVRVAKAMGYDFKYMQVDEFRTTMCCYKCEQRMKDVYDEQGNVVLLRLGLKKCVHCQDTEKNNSFKLRNRDLNAALNMWRITEAVLADEERPSYLKRSPKRSRADTAELGGPHNSEYACNWQA